MIDKQGDAAQAILDNLNPREYAREYAMAYRKMMEDAGPNHKVYLRQIFRKKVRESLAYKYPEEDKLVRKYLAFLRDRAKKNTHRLPTGSHDIGGLISQIEDPQAIAGWRIIQATGVATIKMNRESSVNDHAKETQPMIAEVPNVVNDTPASDGWKRAKRAKQPFDAIMYLVNKVGYLPDVLTMAKLMGLTQADVYALLTQLKKTHDCTPYKVTGGLDENGKEKGTIYIYFYNERPKPPKSDKEIVLERIENLSAQDLRTLAELLKGNN